MSRQSADPDHVELRRQQWARETPDLDTVGMAILGRARWITLLVRPAIEAVFAKHGVDSGEFDVISTLLRTGPPYRLRPTELYRSLMISSGGLTDRLARLEKAGLIFRVPDPDDARSRMVELTQEGRRRAELAFREDMALEAQLLSQLSEGDRQDLSALLHKLALAVSGQLQSPDAAASAPG
jgi:DNA-binding MarR family transcriptional regulator